MQELIWCTGLTILIDPPEEVSELLEEIQSNFIHLLTARSSTGVQYYQVTAVWNPHPISL
jgi:hypothetical protein